MRNLKRALSLALASMMLLGMMVIGAGAASITDMDDVTNKDAVSLMVDLGIIEGDNTGAFNPNGTINRAGVAKLAYYIQMGNADPSVYAGMGYFNDIAGHWAEGYINYCYAQNLLDGRGDGTFNPGGSLPVVGLAKVLLNTLGYDSELEGYVGTGWTINATRDAQSIGLLAGVTQGMTETVTRDTAALMFYNALFLRTVEVQYQWDQGIRQPNGYKTSTTPLGYQVYGLVKQDALVTGIDGDGNATLDVAGNATTAVGSVAVSGKLPATPDMVGSTVTLYLKSSGATFNNGVQTGVGTASKLYNTALVASASNTVYTLTGPVSGKTGAAAVAALVAAGTITTETTVNYYKNGTSIGTTADTNIGMKGVVVEFKNTNDTAGVDTVVITEKTAVALTAAPVVGTVNGKTVVTIAEAGIANKDASKVVGYEGLAKGDVILYLNIGGTTYIEKATKITGSVVGNNSTYGALIGGTYYLASELNGKTYDDNDITDTATYDFYLDNGGYIVAAVKVSDGTSVTTNLAVVTDVAWVKPDSSGSLTSTAKPYMEARLVFTDGTSQVVKVASVDGIVPVAVGTVVGENLKYNNGSSAATTVAAGTATAKTFYYVAKDTTVTGKYYGVESAADLTATDAKALSNTTTITTGNFITTGLFYNYSVNAKGEYVLTSLNALTQGSNQNVNSTITNGKPNFTGSLVGNANTVFVYATTNAAGETTYTVYTGIANVPTTSGTVSGTAIKNPAGVVTYVFVNIQSTVTASTDLVYILSDDYTSVTGETAYLYEVLLNGTATTLKLATTGYNAGELYAVESISDKDVYTLSNTNIMATADTGIKSVVGNVLLAGSNAYAYASGTPAYVVDGKTVVATTVDALALDGNDKVAVIKAADNTVLAVYVTKVSQEATNVTIETATAKGATVDEGALWDGTNRKVGAVSNWVKDTADSIKVTVTAAAGTTLVSVSLDGTDLGDVTSGTPKDYVAVAGTGTRTLVVTVRDNNSGANSSFSYTFTVDAPAAPAP